MSRERLLDRIADPHAELRQRLAAHLGVGGDDAAAVIARRIGVGENALGAFVRGAHLAGWAATALAVQLDQDATEYDGRSGQ